MSNGDDLNQTYLEARRDLRKARRALPEGSNERLAVENSIKELDIEMIERAQENFSARSSTLKALSAQLGGITGKLDPESLSTAIDKINDAVGKVNTLATKLSDLASSGDDA